MKRLYDAPEFELLEVSLLEEVILSSLPTEPTVTEHFGGDDDIIDDGF